MKKTLLLTSIVFLAACGSVENEGNNTDGVENDEGTENEGGTDTSEEADENEENTAEGSDDPLAVYTSLYPYEFFAEEIGGGHVDVTNIVPIGADAHTFEPTANQMIDIAEGDLFIYNGAGYEGFVEAVTDAAANENTEMLEVTEGMDLLSYDHDHAHEQEEDEHNNHGNHNESSSNDEGDNHAHDDNNHNDSENHEEDNHAGGEEDPHVWLDPVKAAEAAENMKDKLTELRPEQEEVFTENFEALEEELLQLDESFQSMVDEADKNLIVVSHAGYGYWEDRYGIEQLGIAGLSPSNEPSIQQVESTVERMESEGVEYVMFEQNIPSDITETVQEQTGAEGLDLHNLEALTEEDTASDENYFTLMESNLEALRTALQ
ncbi:metal ABC transporter solute-binding protein, Zn/Mn family [Alkalicoccus urumqiensis]|uniref:ABC transporter substrate-binding protein n=1 Tax=Alkalicoccus urumqiensis TaxID=1548213 RepID=A0A2P6MKA8_ALKUR|nr:zinc ABC transporter substrate-binding protein [Alkalicoccus urumqiensis]PRO66729.1 ABC transporter substrate-binding protein [Alkalicoccus urumqiensis]